MKHPVGNLIAKGSMGLLYISEEQPGDGHTQTASRMPSHLVLFKSTLARALFRR